MQLHAFKVVSRSRISWQNLFGEGVAVCVVHLLCSRAARKERHAICGIGSRARVRDSGVAHAVLALYRRGCRALVDLYCDCAWDSRVPSATLRCNSVRILFPGAALLVLSAWCLGLLNSHRRFSPSDFAPGVLERLS